MNIQILDSHLREFLDTKATATKIGECLALSGPSVERVEPFGKDTRYDIEITTNRVDTASVIGIAREASAILSEFGIKAELKKVNYPKITTSKKSLPFVIKPQAKLNKRVIAVVIEKIKNDKSPKWMIDRLEAAGIRSKNILIDITNYVMIETGHPTHVFDYDALANMSANKIPYLEFKLSRKGDKLTTLDNKNYELSGNDIIIKNKSNEIIDLPGIMGTKNSAVNDSTKRIIFFIDNNDTRLMRKTSLALNIRTMAVQLNEKQVDPELADIAMKRGVELYKKFAHGEIASKIYDYYPNLRSARTKREIKITQEFINKIIGIEIPVAKVKNILERLGFEVKFNAKTKVYLIKVPSWRMHEVEIPEDIIEEIARIYGYHNLPSELMTGAIPLILPDPIFKFENKIKDILRGFGGYEIYTLSLVSKDQVGEFSLKLRNPLGGDTEYLRTSLIPSMISAATSNARYDRFHLFEIANIYLPFQNGLPEEKLHLAGIFKGYTYREAKGILEGLFEILHIQSNFKMEGKSISINHDREILGYIEIHGDNITYEFSVAALMKVSHVHVGYKAAPKYPAQVEDVTISFGTNVKIGDVINTIKEERLITNIELGDIYKASYTFTVWYQDNAKTLSDADVTKIRDRYLKAVKEKFGGVVKD